jgi:hypothetical protein
LQRVLVGVAVATAVLVVVAIWWGRNREQEPMPSSQVVSEAQAAFFNHVQDPQSALDVVRDIHAEANQMVGYGETPNWDTFHSQQCPKVTQQVDALLKAFANHSDSQNDEIKRIVVDIQNMKSLLRIADKDHDRQALLYLHRIASDLAEFVFTKDGNPDEYWAATHALGGSQAGVIDEFISKHS